MYLECKVGTEYVAFTRKLRESKKIVIFHLRSVRINKVDIPTVTIITSTYAIGNTLDITWYAVTTVRTICVTTLSVISSRADCVNIFTFINVYAYRES